MTTPLQGLTLIQIDQLAEAHHAGQVDKTGHDYIEHPRRVARYVAEAGGSDVQVAAALLHDTVEDTSATLDSLREVGVDPRVLRLVGVLTHRSGQPRREYIAQIASEPGAALVKLCDIHDNTDPARIVPDEETWARLAAKYDTDRQQLAELVPSTRLVLA